MKCWPVSIMAQQRRSHKPKTSRRFRTFGRLQFSEFARAGFAVSRNVAYKAEQDQISSLSSMILTCSILCSK